jgi:N-acyl-D-amino-acid deacylase
MKSGRSRRAVVWSGHLRRGALTIAILAAAAHTWTAQPAVIFDVIIRHATIVDGTGGERYGGDVAISKGSIARIGDLSRERAAREVDAAGLVVAPGFINIHSHATADGLLTAENMLTQGVTTEIVNADGAGPLDIAGQLERAGGRGLAVNLGAQIGFNSVWAQVIGAADRRATAQDIDRMRALITDGLTNGAWGVSAGLDYKPAYFAQAEEVIKVVEAAKPFRTIFINHDRVTPESGFSSRAGMEETIAIGERAGITPVITHMKVQGHEQGSAQQILTKMREATNRGAYTAADAYPYLAGQTGLAALIIPGWAQDGGRDAMLKRFADPQLRARIVREAEEAMDKRFGGAAGVYLPATMQELTTVMRELDVRAGEAVVRLLEQGSPGIIARFGSEADLVKILQHPTTSIACDCGAVVPGAASHPRYYGSFPRVLGRYVREQKALTLEDAVRKMSGLPAATIGMVDRGLLAVGMSADVVIFDAGTIIDHATFEQPTLPSDGVRFVWVNGELAIENGAPTLAKAGQPLRRRDYMPTRPMDLPATKRTLKGDSPPRDGSDPLAMISVDVMQSAPDRRARGHVWVGTPASHTIEMFEFGVMQTADHWVSVTGRGSSRESSGEQAMTLTVDGDSAYLTSAGGLSVKYPFRRAP